MIIADRSSYTVAQIEEYLLAKAKRRTAAGPGAGDDHSPGIPRAKGDWIIGPIRPGTADPSYCRQVLAKLEARLRGDMPVQLDERRN
jgi:hypothetical protein